MYGPVDGRGFVEESFAGEFGGTSAANSVARMYSKSPWGDFNLIVIVPAVSSALMPLMWPFFVFAIVSVPTMFPKKPTPGESIL